MTVLRQQMLDDMRIRNLAAETQTSYLRQVAKFARYHGQSPELLGPEDIRTYQLHLLDDRQLAPTSVAGAVAALRFLYQVTLKRDWAVEALPMPKRGDTNSRTGQPSAATATLSAPEFIRRFLLHVLPTGFHRIRYYGLFGNRHRTAKLARCRQLLDMATPPPVPAAADYRDRHEALTEESLRTCPNCGDGHMKLVETLSRACTRPAIIDTS